ncbi:MAG: V-type ATPase 116kDa subunit family protein [Candidatus ainarchaeum sp.]|nr:V-type ATPase 116kDa subunit family protein [Candidatus ainarchaeum sp.]
MRKVRLIVLKSTVEPLVKDLHLAGIIDIRKTKYSGLEEGRPLASFDEVSGELLKLRALLAMMEPALGKKEHGETAIMDGPKAMAESRALGPLEEKLRAINQEAALLGERSKALENEALAVEKILHFKSVDFGKLDTRVVGYKVGEMKPESIQALNEKLDKAGGHSTLVSEAGHNAVLAVFEKKNLQAVEVLLFESGFNDIELPRGITTPMDTINRINDENEKLKVRLKEINSEMAKHASVEIGKVRGLVRSLELEAERAEVASRFSSSKCLYVLEGWAIESDLPKVQEIARKYGNNVFMEDVKFGHDEMPPTVLDNPKIAGPLEFITKSYSPPNYFELDPTMMYFIGFPLIYGLIVGDVLYGLLSFLIAMWLMKKFEKSYVMRNVCTLWMYAAVPTVLFGLVFDEWGGMSHFALLQYIGKWTGITLANAPLYTGFHRIEEALILIAATVLIGMLHLAIGFAMGAVNEWNHNRKHAFAKIAWIGMEVGGLLALASAIGMAPQIALIAGLVILVISAIVIAVGEGIVGVIEIPGLLGNILSYTRIAAIGIVGIVLAELINSALMPLPEQGLLAIAFIPLFFILHAVNCFIAMFEALIQGGRLNIVEFKSKFLQGGGDIFMPFTAYSKS